MNYMYLSCIQITEVQIQVTESTEALKEATSVMTETRRRYQALDIEMQSALSLVRTFVPIYIISATSTLIVSPVVIVYH